MKSKGLNRGTPSSRAVYARAGFARRRRAIGLLTHAALNSAATIPAGTLLPPSKNRYAPSRFIQRAFSAHVSAHTTTSQQRQAASPIFASPRARIHNELCFPALANNTQSNRSS